MLDFLSLDPVLQIVYVSGKTYGLVSRWSATRPLQGGGIAVLSNLLSSFLFVRTTFVTELPNLKW